MVAQNIGDVDQAMPGAVTKVEATYHVPFLAHATMEPMNCTAHVRPDGCDVWVGNQALRAPKGRCKGRRSAVGQGRDAQPSDRRRFRPKTGERRSRACRRDRQARRRPGQVVWTREEDIQHDMYRPMFFDRLSAGLDAKGMPVAWNNRFAGPSIIARWLPPGFNNGLDPDTTEGAIDLVYGLPNFRVEYVRVEPPAIPTAFWRSVGPSHNVFVTESFMDELAAAAGQDPVAYRLALLDKTPRAKAVLALAADKADWGQKFRRVPAAGFRPARLCKLYGALSPKLKWRRTARSVFDASFAQSIAASSSIPTPSARRCRARSCPASLRRSMARLR